MASNLPGWGRETSPFHSGERELHRRLGIEARQDGIGRKILRPFMPDEHRDFFGQLPFVILGSVDPTSGAPWASALFGAPGFIRSPDDKTLEIDAVPIAGDPLAANAQIGAPVSVVGVELETRRRNRANATVTRADASGLALAIDMSFGNCPQYIQTRAHRFETRTPTAPRAFTALPADVVDVIQRADTFFVASHNPEDDQHDVGGVDVNHRGGRPGFVKVDGNRLTIPDFRGNFAFNTFGNFLRNPVAGLLFVAFDTGDMVQLTGRVELHWDLTPELAAFPGAERGWSVEISHGHVLGAAAPLSWDYKEQSPRLEGTGTWQPTEPETAKAEAEAR